MPRLPLLQLSLSFCNFSPESKTARHLKVMGYGGGNMTGDGGGGDKGNANNGGPSYNSDDTGGGGVQLTVAVVITCIVAATGGLIFGYDIGISGTLLPLLTAITITVSL